MYRYTHNVQAYTDTHTHTHTHTHNHTHTQEYLSALTELAPDTQTRNHSLEAASTAAKELEEVKGQLEADRAKRETHFQAERESKLPLLT